MDHMRTGHTRLMMMLDYQGIMYLLVIPMILLLTYIVIASSEAVLDQMNRYSPFERRDLAFILKKKYQEIRAQIR